MRRVETLAASLGGPAVAAVGDVALSPTTRLAAMLKEALAANTIGGKADEDARWRAAQEDLRLAQASWAQNRGGAGVGTPSPDRSFPARVPADRRATA